MNLLITGGAGFIGANTAAYYLAKKHHVTIFDNLSRPGVKNNIAWLQQRFPKKNLEVIIASVTDFEKLCQAVKNKKVIFHLAGQTAVTTSITNPRLDFESNALGS